MFSFFTGRKKKKIEDEVKKINQTQEDMSLPSSYDEILFTFKTLFTDDDTMKFREFVSGDKSKRKFCIIYCNGLTDTAVINDNIIKPIMLCKEDVSDCKIINVLSGNIIQSGDIKETSSILDIIDAVTYGDTFIFTENSSKGVVVDTKSFSTRSIGEPESEKILVGPREGFCEAMMTNLSLIRRRLRTNQLKMKFMPLGRQTHTQVCIAYMDNIINKGILKELYRRLDQIELDGILDVNYINELIGDNPWSPFRTTGYTERPDVVVGKLLEGRIALFVDGTPVVLTLPYLFIENFQSSEDYYLGFYYASFSRMLRIAGFFLAALVPAIYIAIVAYHHELLPSSLLISIAVERANAPLPAALEAFLMLLAFDMLRETGIRMPSNMGQAMSIVGALVIGQAAVQAKLVAAPMIIVVAVTGISSLLIPRMEGPLIFIRFALLALSSSLGFLGIITGGSIILIHILNLRSFGISQITPDRELHLAEVNDSIIRVPWWHMISRPYSIVRRNKIRQDESGSNKL